MRALLHLFLWTTVLNLSAATVTSDRERLRSLLSLPRFTSQFGFGISSRDGLKLFGDEDDPAEAIARLTKDLTGQTSDGPRIRKSP